MVGRIRGWRLHSNLGRGAGRDRAGGEAPLEGPRGKVPWRVRVWPGRGALGHDPEGRSAGDGAIPGPSASDGG